MVWGMKVIIQIPYYNEEATIGQVVKGLPSEVAGVDCIETLIIDGGSTDGTADAARAAGAHHVLRLGANRGYGIAFQSGIRRCLELDADIIVNTDGDNQYRGNCVAQLIRPILDEDADIVIGSRPIEAISDFSWLKKKLQRIGSHIASKFTGTHVPDATSGFRAYSADAAMRLHLITPYSHSLETVIQAGNMHMVIANVEVDVNPRTRNSRLMTSMWDYIWKSALIIMRSYIRYRPMRTFCYLAIPPALIGGAIGVRFLIYFFTEVHPTGDTQSLLLASILLIIAFLLVVLGIIADLTGVNRELLQEILYMEQVHRLSKIRSEKRE